MRKSWLLMLLVILSLSCNDSTPFYDLAGPPQLAGPPRTAASTRAMEEYPNTVGTTWTYYESNYPFKGLAELHIRALDADPSPYRLRAILEVDTGQRAYGSSIDYAGDTVFMRYMNVTLVLPMKVGGFWGYYHEGIFDRAFVEDTGTVETGAGRFAGAFRLRYNVLTQVEELWYVPRVGVVRYHALKRSYELFGYHIKSPVVR